MDLKQEIRGDVAVLTLPGDIVSTPDISDFHDQFRTLLQKGYKKLVVDMVKADWFGSAMLGALVASLTTLRNAGGDLRLVNIPKRMVSVFAATQLVTLFAIHESVDQAAASYDSGPSEAEQPG